MGKRSLIKERLKLRYIILGILLLFIISAGISAIICYYCINVKEYSVAIEGIEHETKVVLISDLHSRQFGKDNEKLIAVIEKQNPSAIFMVGDMINADADNSEIDQLTELVGSFCEIAPVFFSPGNTEMDCMAAGEDVLEDVRQAGAYAMLDDYLETEINGNRINIGFTMGHYAYTKEQRKNPPDYAMEKTVGADGTPAIVLRHMPEGFFLDKHGTWTGDLYLCGHTHGGLWRIPGIGGVFAPTQGYFPKYDSGYFTFDDGKYQMIINPGFAGHKWIPRLFNMPEVSVITLTGKTH